MNNYKVYKSEGFRQSLSNELSYLANRSEQQAFSVYYNLMEEIEKLDILPKRYHHIKDNLYYFICKYYRIYYMVDDTNKEVNITDIINTRENDINIG